MVKYKWLYEGLLHKRMFLCFKFFFDTPFETNAHFYNFFRHRCILFSKQKEVNNFRGFLSNRNIFCFFFQFCIRLRRCVNLLSPLGLIVKLKKEVDNFSAFVSPRGRFCIFENFLWHAVSCSLNTHCLNFRTRRAVIFPELFLEDELFRLCHFVPGEMHRCESFFVHTCQISLIEKVGNFSGIVSSRGSLFVFIVFSTTCHFGGTVSDGRAGGI